MHLPYLLYTYKKYQCLLATFGHKNTNSCITLDVFSGLQIGVVFFFIFDETILLKNAGYTDFMRQENDRQMRVNTSVKKTEAFFLPHHASLMVRKPFRCWRHFFNAINNPDRLTDYWNRLSWWFFFVRLVMLHSLLIYEHNFQSMSTTWLPILATLKNQLGNQFLHFF